MASPDLRVNIKQRGRGGEVPSGRSEPSLSTDIPWGRRGWLVMLGSCVYITGRNGSWYKVWCCETDGELEGAGSAPSLPWLLSEGVRVGVCGLVFVSWVGVEFLVFVTSSSLVVLSGLLLCEENRAVGIKNGLVKNITYQWTNMVSRLRKYTLAEVYKVHKPL